ncbi:hypoxia up-regulated protein 1-like isoform X3 [Babylonia areolata]|uniref:hypoxia up-regulated protein 1-like isoform X3 n=1 Tax=Babylonia areolata TaxID=304850 RepID=UPI003FD23FDB
MHWFGPPRALFCFTLLALCLPALGRLAVMSIDLGGEFMKIAIVKPGVPMEIVLNKESSRKTRSIVAFRDGERHFANDAYNTGVRFPSKAFWFLTHIIGRSYDDPVVEQFRQRFTYYKDSMVKDEERGTVLFKESDGTLYSTEELLGMMLEKAREYAQDFAEQTIKDAVITVPPYYSQAERRAVITAAELVGINVLQLMNDNAAVALNYGVFRRKNFNTTAQYYMFYDMGATSTVATVVSYQVVKTKEGTRVDSNPQLTVKGVGYDRTLGGLEMTLRLRDHLAQVFNGQKKRPVKVEDSPRAMAKLLKEAERVKKVLSANVDHKAQVEGLLEGEDFSAKVTREEYLNLIKDLLERVTKPVEDALKTSEITMPEISEIILMGGGSRLPRVQELLLEHSGKSDLGKSINTDEAAALGAVYQAAFLGKGFKVKTFHVRDANIYPVNVEFEKQKTAEDGQGATARTIKRTLFGRMNPYPQRKVMTFNKHFKDFTFDVRYGDLEFMPEAERKAFASQSLTNVNLTGVETAYAKHGEEAEYKGVKAHFRMDESGILHLEKVEAVFEKQEAPEPEPKEDESTWSTKRTFFQQLREIGSAFGGLFGGKEEEGKAEEGKTDSSEEGAADAPSHAGANGNRTDTASDSSGQAQTGSNRSEPGQTGSGKSEAPPQTESPSQKDEQEEMKKKEAKEEKEEEPTEKKKDEDAEKKEDKEEEKPAKEEQKSEQEEEKKKEEEGKDEKEGKDEEKKDGEKEKEQEEKKKEEDKKEEKKEEPKKPAAPKTVVLKENIEASVEVKDMPDLSADKFKQARKRLEELQKKDQEKVALEKAKNELEGFIFDMQDKLSQDLYQACSKEEERESILQKLSEASDWLYEQPDDSKKEVFTNKLTELKTLMRNISQRVYEKEERPKALEALRHHLNATTHFLATVHNMTDPEDPMFTPVELTTLEKLINETTAWRDEAVKNQEKLADHENPVLLVEAIGSKIYALEREMKYLINKAKNFRPKPKAEKAGDNSTTAKTNGTDTADKKKKANETKTEEEGKGKADDDDDDGKVEDEGEEEFTGTTSSPPESQEATPDTDTDSSSKEGDQESTLEKPQADKQPQTEAKSDDEKSSKKKRPKKKREQEESKSGEEEILELEREDRSTYHPRNIDRDL